MEKQTCHVVSIDLETKPWEPDGKGTWVITVDHSEKSEFRIPENPNTSEEEAELAENLTEWEGADLDLVADVRANTSPMTPDTTYSIHNVREA